MGIKTKKPELARKTLSSDLLRKMNAYWRAANYLSVGQIYLYDNPLLKKPLTLEHVKPRLLGHWGTTPGLNFIYVHLNRIIKRCDLNMLYVTGPGHGGPGLVANTYLVTDHCLRSRHYVNVIVAGKQPSPQWLDMESAVKHCTAGLGIWKWASNDEGGEPDVVMACAGDVPTMETLTAVMMLRRHFPELTIRVINVVDLMVLQPQSEHPHGLSDKDFDVLFTRDKPIVFAFHGYPSLIHQLTYRRTNHHNLHVRGYKEEGTTTTPFDMAVRNDIDRFHLVKDVVDRVSSLGLCAAYLTQIIQVRNWKWGATETGKAGPARK